MLLCHFYFYHHHIAFYEALFLSSGILQKKVVRNYSNLCSLGQQKILATVCLSRIFLNLMLLDGKPTELTPHTPLHNDLPILVSNAKDHFQQFLDSVHFSYILTV